jgi:non-ribosomal peptide synthetase component F
VPDRDASRPALVQALLVLQNAPADALSLPGLELSVLPQGTGTAKFEITLALTETAQGLACQVEYRRELFDAATIARLAAGYARLLAGVAADPHRRISDLPLLSAAERHQILVECIVPHSWAVGERVFHTGELVRQGANGAIESLAGEIDNRASVL